VNKCHSRCHNATKKEDNQETLGKVIWRGKCGQRASYLAGKRWKRQSSDVTVHRLFLDLITALQPLAQLPFHLLEYDFELNRLERNQQRQAAADADPAAGVRRSLARQSFSTEEAI